VQLKGFAKLKISLNSSGLEPATYRLVAQRHNHLQYLASLCFYRNFNTAIEVTAMILRYEYFRKEATFFFSFTEGWKRRSTLLTTPPMNGQFSLCY
jgi:hypothetical protein